LLLRQEREQRLLKPRWIRQSRRLKSSGKVKEVELEIRPQANGIRILFICQPALYFGLFDFPGAAGKFTYSRLLQVSDYPPRGAYSAVDVGTSQALHP